MFIQLGIPTLIETKKLEECAELCNEFGFHFIELNMNMPQYQLESMDVNNLAEIAARYGIYYTIHLDENLNVCDFNKRVANAYTDTVLQAIELAKVLKIPILNMHMSKGVHFKLPDRKVNLFDEYQDTYLDSLSDFRNRCENAIGDSEIKICIENTDGYDADFIQKGLALLLKSKKFGLTFDIGHNAIIGGRDEDIIMQYKNKLCHMHIHDATDTKNHLPLGSGSLDLKKYIHMAVKNNCRTVFETKTIGGLRQSVDWVKNRWREFEAQGK